MEAIRAVERYSALVAKAIVRLPRYLIERLRQVVIELSHFGVLHGEADRVLASSRVRQRDNICRCRRLLI